jgi:MSHA biogenesis protein MshL
MPTKKSTPKEQPGSFFMFRYGAIAAACAMLASGCSSSAKLADMKETVRSEMATSIETVKAQDAPTKFGLRHVSKSSEIPGEAYVVANVGDDEDRGTVTMQVNGPLSSIVGGLANSASYSLAWGGNIDRNKAVSLSVAGVSEISAIRRVAAAAGYVAVIDREARMITIAESGVYTFKLPIQVMQQLDTTFSVGGNPLSTGGGSGGPPGMPGGGGGGGGALQASFNVNGRVGTNGRNWVDYLREVAGANASISASIETGYVSVRGNGVALERVRGFLQKFADTAMRRVEIQASVIDIALNDEFQFGVDWSRLLASGIGGLGGAINIGVSGGAAAVPTSGGTPSLSLAYTSSNISSIINFLKTKTDIKVITQPSITAMNRTPAVIFDGVQIPYLGSISTTAQQVSTTTSAEASFVVDGVNLSILPEIMSDTEAQITILPVVSGVREFKTFDIGQGAQIVAPVQLSKQALMTAMAENGKTVVLGGIRYTSDGGIAKQLPGVNVPIGKTDTTVAREVAILIRANVVPGKRHNILFAESI